VPRKVLLQTRLPMSAPVSAVEHTQRQASCALGSPEVPAPAPSFLGDLEVEGPLRQPMIPETVDGEVLLHDTRRPGHAEGASPTGKPPLRARL